MKKLLLLVASVLLAHTLTAAETEAKPDAKTQAKNAARKLADQTGYTWIATTQIEGAGQNSRMGPQEGKAEKGGYTHVVFTLNNNEIELAFKGGKSAIKLEGDWQSAEDLEGGDRDWIAGRLKIFKAAAGEALELADMAKALAGGDGGVLSGDLTEVGAKEMFSRNGRRSVEAKDAKGSVKFWLKDGALVKYEFHLEGKMTINDEERAVQRTTTVEIKQVGATKVSLPDEAKKKLS